MKTGTVTTTSAAAPPITDHFHRSDQRTTGSYMRMRKRLMTCESSDRIRPTITALVTRQSHVGRKSKRRTRVKSTRNTGSSVTTRPAATSIVSVLV
jgi:hypothetical protein